jgi:hypothetical protein
MDGKIPYGERMGFPFDRRIVAQEHFFTSSMKVIHLNHEKRETEGDRVQKNCL